MNYKKECLSENCFRLVDNKNKIIISGATAERNTHSTYDSGSSSSYDSGSSSSDSSSSSCD